MKYVYIHGRGQHDDLTVWRQAWALRLEEAGFEPPELGDDVWVEIDYQDLLDRDFAGQTSDWPAAPPVPGEAVARYDARNAPLRGSVTRPPAISPVGVLEQAVDLGAKFAFKGKIPVPGKLAEKGIARLLKDVNLFVTSRPRQQAIIDRVLDCIPPGDVVIITHSLGTVVTLATLPYLPTDTHVRLLITAGSPAATETMQSSVNLAGAPSSAPFPVDRVDTWLNLVDVFDPVTSGNGLGDTFDHVIDHLAKNSKSGEGVFSVHSIWSYLKTPIIATAIKLALDPPDHSTAVNQPEWRMPDELLTAAMAVRLADCLSISASLSKVHRRTRDFIDERLLPDDAGFLDTLTRRRAATGVRQWAASQSTPTRVASLVEASQADPFAPFEPGLEQSDVADGIERFGRDLGLPPGIGFSALELRNSVDRALRSRGRISRVLGVTALSVAAVGAIALGGPAVIGIFASGGATGAAAFTSGLAALGLGSGMAGGVAALGGVAAGLGLAGGAVAHRIGDVAIDEEAFLTMLVTELVHIRLLRRTGSPDAVEAAEERRRRLDDVVRGELTRVAADHDRFSHHKSTLHKTIQRNIEHVSRGVQLLDSARNEDAAVAAGL
jgi:hypothetical protein